MLSIQKHCATLHKSIIESTYPDENEFDPVCYWLQLSAGLFDVNYDNKYTLDDSSVYCSTAYKFDRRLSRLNKIYVFKMTQFLFIWGALESIYDSLEKALSPTVHGKINKICHKLSTLSGNRHEIPYHTRVLNILNILSSKVSWANDLFVFEKKAHINHKSVGLWLSYKIRNKIAHGDKIIPASPYSEANSLSGLSLFPIASRLTLFAIQMLLINELGDSTPTWTHDAFPLGFSYGVDPNCLFQNLHLDNFALNF